MHVTFFVVGENGQGRTRKSSSAPSPRDTRSATTVGDHPNLAKMSDEAVQIRTQPHQGRHQAATGGKPVTLMRPPYGSFTKEQRRWFHDDLGYTTILWDVDPLDWKRPGAVGGRATHPRRHAQRLHHPFARHPPGHRRGDAGHVRQTARQGIQVRHGLGIDRHEPARAAEARRRAPPKPARASTPRAPPPSPRPRPERQPARRRSRGPPRQ